MLAKIVLVALVAVAAADRRPSPSYSPPRQPSYSPPRQPSYSPPQQPSYSPPRQPSYSAPRPSYREPESGPAQYHFDWAVNDQHSGNDFGQQESRDGYNTEGSYYVQLPDGRLQRVSYNVNGDSGFLAEVQYEGKAQYPEQRSYQSKPRPSYQQPKPQPTYQRPRPTYN